MSMKFDIGLEFYFSAQNSIHFPYGSNTSNHCNSTMILCAMRNLYRIVAYYYVMYISLTQFAFGFQVMYATNISPRKYSRAAMDKEYHNRHGLNRNHSTTFSCPGKSVCSRVLAVTQSDAMPEGKIAVGEISRSKGLWIDIWSKISPYNRNMRAESEDRKHHADMLSANSVEEITEKYVALNLPNGATSTEEHPDNKIRASSSRRENFSKYFPWKNENSSKMHQNLLHKEIDAEDKTPEHDINQMESKYMPTGLKRLQRSFKAISIRKVFSWLRGREYSDKGPDGLVSLSSRRAIGDADWERQHREYLDSAKDLLNHRKKKRILNESVSKEGFIARVTSFRKRQPPKISKHEKNQTEWASDTGNRGLKIGIRWPFKKEEIVNGHIGAKRKLPEYFIVEPHPDQNKKGGNVKKKEVKVKRSGRMVMWDDDFDHYDNDIDYNDPINFAKKLNATAKSLPDNGINEKDETNGSWNTMKWPDLGALFSRYWWDTDIDRNSFDDEESYLNESEEGNDLINDDAEFQNNIQDLEKDRGEQWSTTLKNIFYGWGRWAWQKIDGEKSDILDSPLDTGLNAFVSDAGTSVNISSAAIVDDEALMIQDALKWTEPEIFDEKESANNESIRLEEYAETGSSWNPLGFFFPSNEAAKAKSVLLNDTEEVKSAVNPSQEYLLKLDTTFANDKEMSSSYSVTQPIADTVKDAMKQEDLEKSKREKENSLWSEDFEGKIISPELASTMELDSVSSAIIKAQAAVRASRQQKIKQQEIIQAPRWNFRRQVQESITSEGGRESLLQGTSSICNELQNSLMAIAIDAAASINQIEELKEFEQEGGLYNLLQGLVDKNAPPGQSATAAHALSRLVALNVSVSHQVLGVPGLMTELKILLQAPTKWGGLASSVLSPPQDRALALHGQEAAAALMFELAVASDRAIDMMRSMELQPIIDKIIEKGLSSQQSDTSAVKGPSEKTYQNANRLAAALGYGHWRPRMPGQRGLRILCLDGGGTRGVLTVSLLKQVMAGVGKEPHEVFDLICGTSTGGILATLFVCNKCGLEEVSKMYDELILKIFNKIPWLSNFLLVRDQALYAEGPWELILKGFLGERRMIDIEDSPSAPKLAMCSTIMNVDPLQMMVWRSYNYPVNMQPPHEGSFRKKVWECVRATTAAPTYFKPFYSGGLLYGDGALLANNPTALALSEARLVFPGIPVEAVVSIGTGYVEPILKPAAESGWKSIVAQVVNSATDTETVNTILKSLLPEERYFRFNPRIEAFPIDETSPERLAYLKQRASEYFEGSATEQARLRQLWRILRGDTAWTEDPPGRAEKRIFI